MTIYQHAAQIWSVLVLAARNRQTVTYDVLGKLIGIPQFGLGQHLEPIQSYCLLNVLPAHTSLVVTEAGSPSHGFTAAQLAEVPKAQADVFKFDWLGKAKAPTPDALKEAAAKRPSNGVPQDATP